tara:strand:+ start:252 stop:818 length:567 start_codon:yes stop_codon:yes gene_type:complete
MNEEMMALIESIAKTGGEGLLGFSTSPNVFQDMATLAKLPKQIKDRASGKKTYREFLLEENTGNGKTFAESIGLMPSRMSLEELMQEFTEQYKKSPRLQEKPEAAKSIDDIIKQADMAEFLSEAMAENTNVDVSQMPMKKDRLKYSSDTIIDFLNSLSSGYREPSFEERVRTFPGRLQDLTKDKPSDS